MYGDADTQRLRSCLIHASHRRFDVQVTNSITHASVVCVLNVTLHILYYLNPAVVLEILHSHIRFFVRIKMSAEKNNSTVAECRAEPSNAPSKVQRSCSSQLLPASLAEAAATAAVVSHPAKQEIYFDSTSAAMTKPMKENRAAVEALSTKNYNVLQEFLKMYGDDDGDDLVSYDEDDDVDEEYVKTLLRQFLP